MTTPEQHIAIIAKELGHTVGLYGDLTIVWPYGPSGDSEWEEWTSTTLGGRCTILLHAITQLAERGVHVVTPKIDTYYVYLPHPTLSLFIQPLICKSFNPSSLPERINAGLAACAAGCEWLAEQREGES